MEKMEEESDDTIEVEDNNCLIDTLPDEIIVLIFRHVTDMFHLHIVVPQVCKRFHRLANDKLVWNKKRLFFHKSKQTEDYTYLKKFIKIFNEAPCLSSVDLSEVAVEVEDVEGHLQPCLRPMTKVLNYDSGAKFKRNMGLKSLSSSTYHEGLLDLLRGNKKSLRDVTLRDVELDELYEAAYGHFYDLEKIKQSLLEITEALKNLPHLQHLSLEFNEVWEHGSFRTWYEDMDRIIYSSILQMSELKSLCLIHARPVIYSVSSAPAASWPLTELLIYGESYFNDQLAAKLISAAAGTLRVFKSGANTGTETAKALAKCKNLEVLQIPGLEDIYYFQKLKNIYSFEIYSLEEIYNQNVNVDFIAQAPVLGTIKEFGIEVLKDRSSFNVLNDYVDVVQALIRKCEEVTKFKISEFAMMSKRPFVYLAPKIVDTLINGAMPKLDIFDIHSGAHHKEWKEPLSLLRRNRPELQVVHLPWYLRKTQMTNTN